MSDQYSPSSSSASSVASRLWFAVILAAVCLWVLSLPIFPTQDGPMHRYYVHVLDSLLQHQSTYDVYRVRHPIPPYATHYGSLLALFHIFPYDLAEKLFTCIVVCCLACGLRLSAREIGPAGRWASLLCAPLLLGWPLMMGFFNFTLALGLLLICTAFWQRLVRKGVRALLPFALVLILLTFTHPIPLLLLILLCGMDLVLAFVFKPGETALAPWARLHRFQFIALLLTVIAAAFPALAVDSSRTATTLNLFGFHPEFLRTSLLLSGISPYNSRSMLFSVNAYRLCLYLIYGGCMLVGARAFLHACRSRTWTFGNTLFVATATLTIALPFLPNLVNGSDYFSSRLVFVLWPAAILAASASTAPSPRTQRWLAPFAAACCVLTLLPAELLMRPIARQLLLAEHQVLPHGVPGAILMGDAQDDYVRFKKQLAFDPYKWGTILAFVHAGDVALDSPWIDQKITPIEAVPGGPELVSDIAYTRIRKMDSPDAPAVRGRSLPARREAQIVHDAAFVIFAGTPQELAEGLSGQLSPEEAAKYQCEQGTDWYILCTSKTR